MFWLAFDNKHDQQDFLATLVTRRFEEYQFPMQKGKEIRVSPGNFTGRVVDVPGKSEGLLVIIGTSTPRTSWYGGCEVVKRFGNGRDIRRFWACLNT